MDAHNQEQNRVNMEEEQNNVDLTLRLGVGDSRPRAENSQNQDNFEPGFAMMAGEHNNPCPRVQSSSSVQTSGSATNVQINPDQFNPAVSDTDMASGQNMMSMEEFLRMILSVNHDDSMERLLNEDRGIDAEPADQSNAPNSVDLPENQDDDIEDADDMELLSEDESDDWRLHVEEVYELTPERLLAIERQMEIIYKAGLDEQTISDGLQCFNFYPNETRVSCVICLEDLKAGDSFALLDCGHNNFHPHCLTTWLMAKNECPLCKCVALFPRRS